MDSHQEYVLREVAQKNIRFIRLWFTDVAGVLKSISIDPGELEDAFSEGIGFDGSAVEGLTRVFESDMLLMPDASTFQLLPWRSQRGSCGAHVLRRAHARRSPRPPPILAASLSASSSAPPTRASAS